MILNLQVRVYIRVKMTSSNHFIQYRKFERSQTANLLKILIKISSLLLRKGRSDNSKNIKFFDTEKIICLSRLYRTTLRVGSLF